MTRPATPAIRAVPLEAAPRCVLAESPRWHQGRWWWVDAGGGPVFCAEPGDGEVLRNVRAWLTCGGRVPVVHPATGGMLVARGHILQIFSTSRVTGSALAGPILAEPTLPHGWLLNDGSAGPDGSFYVGAVHPDRSPGSGYLLRVRSDGTVGRVVDGMGLSNGLAWDPAGAVLYHADSSARVVFAHRVDDRGDFVGSTVRLRFADDDGMPDGLATDVDGGLWVAVYGAGQVRRYTPDGELDAVVEVPTPQTTSVALGGPDGRDMVITTAREGYDQRRSAAEPLAGRLFAARAPFPGRAVPLVAPPEGRS